MVWPFIIVQIYIRFSIWSRSMLRLWSQMKWLRQVIRKLMTFLSKPLHLKIRPFPAKSQTCFSSSFTMGKEVKMLKKMILINEWHAKHLFAGQNTQQISERGKVPYRDWLICSDLLADVYNDLWSNETYVQQFILVCKIHQNSFTGSNVKMLKTKKIFVKTNILSEKRVIFSDRNIFVFRFFVLIYLPGHTNFTKLWGNTAHPCRKEH